MSYIQYCSHQLYYVFVFIKVNKNLHFSVTLNNLIKGFCKIIIHSLQLIMFQSHTTPEILSDLKIAFYSYYHRNWE